MKSRLASTVLAALLVAACAVTPPADTVAPSVTIASPGDGATVLSTGATFQGTATDNVGVHHMSYQVEGGEAVLIAILPGSSVDFSFTIALDVGQREVTITAFDAAGNAGSAAVTVEVAAGEAQIEGILGLPAPDEAFGAALASDAPGLREPARDPAFAPPLTGRIIVLVDHQALRLAMLAPDRAVSTDYARQFSREVAALAADQGLRVVNVIAPRLGLVVLEAPDGDAEAAAARLQSDRRVRASSPDHWQYPLAAPNDPFLADLWGLDMVRAQRGWEFSTGDDPVIVAVIDTGQGGPEGSVATAGHHDDLLANLVPGFDFVSCFDVLDAGLVTPDLVDDFPKMQWLDADDECGWDSYPIEEYELDTAGDPPWGTLFAVGSHGTHVAGTVGAVGDNATGVAGVNWTVSVQNLRGLGTAGGFSSDILAAGLYAAGEPVNINPDPGGDPDLIVNPTPARIINMSLGGGAFSSAADDTWTYIYEDLGVLIVAAAGNSATSSPHYPSGYDAVMAVSSIDLILDADGDPANGLQPRVTFTDFFSNFGPTIEVAAPGGLCWDDLNSYVVPVFPNGNCRGLGAHGYFSPFILSTTWRWYSTAAGSPPVPADRVDVPSYSWFAGTSMSSPHVAGAAALLFAIDPALTAAEAREILVRTAWDVDDSDIFGFGEPGWDQYYGWGVLNVAAAARAAGTGQVPAEGANPEPALWVVAVSEDGASSFGVRAGVDLNYSFPELPPGTYTLHAGWDLDGNGVIGETGEFYGRRLLAVAIGAGEQISGIDIIMERVHGPPLGALDLRSVQVIR